jgi:3-deoxy-D-manno-octulosonate 8-phosphate phosphatase (KDO 8-P phosphatase)
LNKNLIEKAKQIKCLLLDVDGVMTNGMLYFDENGKEIKGFSIYDGLGIARCRQASILVAIISGRRSKVLSWRAKELQIEEVHQGIRDKVKTYEQIEEKYQLERKSVAFIGDDLIDLPLLRQVGLSVAVANAVDEVKKEVDWITQRRGGEGAVREVVDFILSAQGIH